MNQRKPRAYLIYTAAMQLILLTICSAAYAELGGGIATVAGDAAKIKSAVRKTDAASYSIHNMTDAHGTAIKEYLSSGGVVFAVSWKGKRQPDLQQLLGTYYTRYSESARVKRSTYKGRRNGISITQSDFVIRVRGHMGFSAGTAYLPDKVPAGIDISSL